MDIIKRYARGIWDLATGYGVAQIIGLLTAIYTAKYMFIWIILTFK